MLIYFNGKDVIKLEAKSTTAERLKLYLSKTGKKQIDIVKLSAPYCKQHGARLGRNDISQYISGKIVPGATKIFILSKALGVSESWLMGFGDDDDMTDQNESEPLERYNPTMHKIPILGSIAAGNPQRAEEDIEGYTYTELNQGYTYFALRVKGDSMNAANIPDGSLLVVREQPTLENGEIGVIRVNGDEATVKRFTRAGDIVMLAPQSYNPKHQTQVYNLQTDDISIIGKVMECKVKF